MPLVIFIEDHNSAREANLCIKQWDASLYYLTIYIVSIYQVKLFQDILQNEQMVAGPIIRQGGTG